MRGGLQRWKRGEDSQGVRAALSYALEGRCDAHIRVSAGGVSLADYSDSTDRSITRFIVEAGHITTDELDREQLLHWVDGNDPLTTERRGRDLASPKSDLVLDGTINAPKSYSLVATIHPALADEFDRLQDRLRDRIITTWQRELNARRGAGGRIRESVHRLEVVELHHRRSRALDPHLHRHLWLNVRVQGEDGNWSNVDSRVAMKLHTVINAEGELAARTDPEWIAALARYGYTVRADGEIAEVSHAIRPLSRRSNQIEANRAVIIARWRDAHPGQHPSREVLQQIDRYAWAQGRPRKPDNLDEDEWEQLIRHELLEIDPQLLDRRPPTIPTTVELAALDRELLAAKAIVEADARSAPNGGRFSPMDVRAGAMRALAASGIVANRDDLQPLIDDVVGIATGHTVNLLESDGATPEHIKGLMAASTAALKVEVADRFDRLAGDGDHADDELVDAAESATLQPGTGLDTGQRDAASAIAGTHRLVAVMGPAGTGKTTMLRVAHRALAIQGRRLVVVAPTKKAASVAGREIGASASSLHALLGDHGWRWTRDDAGAEVWTRLGIGDVDPATGRIYVGPRKHPLAPGDRIVVDEAGMVDLYTARALAQVADETGAGIAMVGDHLQAMPVGHSGAMACMAQRSGAVVELTSVHRFRDPNYAALTLRLREPASIDEARTVAMELDAGGHIHRVGDHLHAQEVMVESYFRWSAERKRVALVTSTNEEADAINEAIQQRRVDCAQIDVMRVAVGMGEQRILEGDVVQTRRNDHVTGVQNRALWTVRRIDARWVELVSVDDRGDVRRVDADYVADHVHLAYASTVHGIQGETTDASVVGPGVDASGLYVGMTRGRVHNEVVAVARDDSDAREQIAESMMRGAPVVTIDDSRRAARAELGRAAVPMSEALDGAGDPRAELGEWIRVARGLLTDMEAAEARRASRTHARADNAAVGHEEDRSRAQALADLVIERERECAALWDRGTQPARASNHQASAPAISVPETAAMISGL
ncbi:AAA family ATPase [Microbacterium sp. 2FI]|uniref:AAA family ATPase n=1 Tax=Microbacterium sp. 2FI TaxID=2502193 RepID=UPI0010F8EB74|nr:AAA family ATPase [Microbacterium sp. 2FI]